MGKRRGEVQIRRDILNVCLKPRKVTEIIRFANIQNQGLEKHLKPLVEADLISKYNHQENKTKYIYETTSEGKQVLKTIKDLAKRIRLEWRRPEVFY